MTTVYFIRHAKANYNNHDDKNRELTEKGLEDRLKVTDYLESCGIDIVYCSPYLRSIQTISHFADKHHLAVNIVDDFRERKVSNTWIDDFETYTKNQWDDVDYKMPLGESFNDVQQRNISALQIVLSKHKNQTIAIGTHGMALGTIINYYDNLFGYAEFKKIRPIMPLIYKFEFNGDELVSMDRISLVED